MSHSESKGRSAAVPASSPEPSLSETQVRVGSFLIEQSQMECSDGLYRLAVELPSSREQVMGSGLSPREAFIDFCTRVSSVVFAEATPGRRASADSTAKDFDLLRELVERRTVQPVLATRTKARQRTVGVTCKTSVLKSIGNDSESETFAAASREFFQRGLDALDHRLDSESSQALFAEFQSLYDAFPGVATEQRMLRLDRQMYERALILAHEYERSLSSLAALCMAYALKHTAA